MLNDKINQKTRFGTTFSNDRVVKNENNLDTVMGDCVSIVL